MIRPNDSSKQPPAPNAAFVGQALPMFEQFKFLERYAWFASWTTGGIIRRSLANSLVRASRTTGREEEPFVRRKSDVRTVIRLAWTSYRFGFITHCHP